MNQLHIRLPLLMDESSLNAAFTRHHNFNISQAFKADDNLVLWLLEIKTNVDTGLAAQARQLTENKEPTWAILSSMLDHVYEHASGAVVAYFTGCWASMEVVLRATIEASVTVMYIIHGDRKNRLGQYLGHYFTSARKALDKSEQLGQRVASARDSLKFREDMIQRVAALQGIALASGGWPASVLDRFKAIGMEEDYRSIYTVLSSQTHSDADALVDLIIVKCVSLKHIPNTEQLVLPEFLTWTRFYVYSALRFYALAAKAFVSAFALSEAAKGVHQAEQAIVRQLESFSRDLENLWTRKPFGS